MGIKTKEDIERLYNSVNLSTNPLFIYNKMNEIAKKARDEKVYNIIISHLREDMNVNGIKIILDKLKELEGIEARV